MGGTHEQDQAKGPFTYCREDEEFFHSIFLVSCARDCGGDGRKLLALFSRQLLRFAD